MMQVTLAARTTTTPPLACTFRLWWHRCAHSQCRSNCTGLCFHRLGQQLSAHCTHSKPCRHGCRQRSKNLRRLHKSRDSADRHRSCPPADPQNLLGSLCTKVQICRSVRANGHMIREAPERSTAPRHILTEKALVSGLCPVIRSDKAGPGLDLSMANDNRRCTPAVAATWQQPRIAIDVVRSHRALHKSAASVHGGEPICREWMSAHLGIPL